MVIHQLAMQVQQKLEVPSVVNDQHILRQLPFTRLSLTTPIQSLTTPIQARIARLLIHLSTARHLNSSE
jgi:hypothetical protein